MSTESRAGLRSLGQAIVRDVAAIADGHPGLAARLEDLARQLGIELSLERDPAFEALFPLREDEDATDDDRQRVETIAAAWATGAPDDAARRLDAYEEEYLYVSHGRANLLPDVCCEITRRVVDLDGWIAALLGIGKPSHLLVLLVRRCVAEQPEIAIDVLDRCLTERDLRRIGVDGALRMAGLPEAMLVKALECSAEFPSHVETLCARAEVPLGTLKRLLASAEVQTRAAAVVGEWLAQPRKEVRSAIRGHWRAAILRTKVRDLDGLRSSASLEFWLGEILRSEPELSLEWLQSALPGLQPVLRLDGPLGEAIDGLSREQRIALLPAVAVTQVPIDPQELPARLVGGDDEVFRSLLSRDSLRKRYGAPLRDPTRDEWARLARCALEAGFSPHDVVSSSLDVSERLGDDSERLNRCLDAFRRLRDGPAPGLADVAREGERVVGEMLAEAAQRKRQQALQGI